MANNVNALETTLSSTRDGVIACNAINKLARLAENGDKHAMRILAEYMRKGLIGHMRDFACASLAEAVTVADLEFAPLFRDGLSRRNLRYWSILGYVNSKGGGAYKDLVALARNTSVPLAERCHAVKCLAEFSKQPFDRALPSDPGKWKETDLRLPEIKAWAKDGYPDGRGYAAPKQHVTLHRPRTALEKIVSRLDKTLIRKRKARQDPADPTDWLAVAAAEDIRRVKARWKLPSVYLDFLTRFSPIKVTLASRRFYNHFQLFGAGELIDAQEGYSFDPLKKRPIADWPAHFVVIASHGGDPFVLDLSRSNGKDAPVETAEHGAGTWDFSREADSFVEFLKMLAK
jgi:hypothetical protein